MGKTTVLAPAAQSGIPAFAQVQQLGPRQRRTAGEAETGAQPAPKKTRGPRRGQRDFWPYPRGNEVEDVTRLHEWVHRGSCKPHQRMIDFRGGRVDVARAWAVLQREGKVGSQPLPPPQTQMQMPAHGPLHGTPFAAPQLPGNLLGAPQFAPTERMTLVGGIPVPAGMAYQPPFQHPGALPAPQWGFQHPPLPLPQVPAPAYHPAAPLLQQTGPLPPNNWAFDPALLVQGTTGFGAGPGPFQGVGNGAGEGDEAPLVLMETTPEEMAAIQIAVANGAAGLPAQINVQQDSSDAAGEEEFKGLDDLLDFSLGLEDSFKI